MLDFPGSPSNGQVFTPVAGGPSWQWDGSKWIAATTGSTAYAPITDPIFQGNPQAPQPAAGDADASIATTAFVTNAVATSLHDVGRNLVHNSMFNIAQRGAGPFTAVGYTADRWQLFVSLDTASFSVQALAPGGIPGDETAAAQFIGGFTGNAGAAATTVVGQPIEDVRRLAGKTVTVSFYAVASAAATKFGVSLDQNFGTGGSPSAQVQGVGQSVTLTTSWARYSLTFTLPSIAGKTLGTNANHNTGLNLWYSAGSNRTTISGGVGVQSATIYLWGVQLELGSVATPLEKLDPVTQLQQCQRFYQVGNFKSDTYSAAGNASGVYQSFPVQMRATPVVTPTFNIQTNGASGGASAVSIYGVEIYTVATAAGYVTISGLFTASADL